MFTTHLPTTPTTLAWAAVLAEEFENQAPRTARALGRYSKCRPPSRREVTRAAYRYADLEVARRRADPQQQAGEEADQVNVTTAFFFCTPSTGTSSTAPSQS